MNDNEVQYIELHDWSVQYNTGFVWLTTRVIVYNRTHLNKNHLYIWNFIEILQLVVEKNNFKVFTNRS